MLQVVELGVAQALLRGRFPKTAVCAETVPLAEALGRAIARDVVAVEGVPPFDRSTVDGFAVLAGDTFGCSEALPALLELVGEVDMGAEPDCECVSGVCVRIPTGGQVPSGADAVVMLEYCEEYGDGMVGVARSVAPGDNIVFAHDDVEPGEVLIDAGAELKPHHIGTLASLGWAACEVLRRVRVAIVSTGDEIVAVETEPVASQMRDVNTPTLAAAVAECGAQPVCFPIVPDDYEALLATVREALSACDIVLVSGGSSAGQKDNTARVLSALGEMLFHGIAVKPGKPTMCADVDGKPVFGLPGHPVAAYFMFLELVRPMLQPGSPFARRSAWGAQGVQGMLELSAVTAAGIPSNHGRAELVAVRLEERDGEMLAHPIRGKSGLISQLSRADGYVEIGRNQEGVSAGASVTVKLFA